jgi:hypothetical protein
MKNVEKMAVTFWSGKAAGVIKQNQPRYDEKGNESERRNSPVFPLIFFDNATLHC